MKEQKVLSLFNGISCGRVAFERANIPVKKYVSYEINEKANKVSKHHYPNDKYYGDVFEADFTQYKGFDILIGGSPCSHWSIARTNHGDRETKFEGVGYELFMQYKRALVESECKYFLYENNNSMSNAIREGITRELGVQPIMINSALVSGQNRERLYWTNIPNVELPKDKNISITDVVPNAVKGAALRNQVTKEGLKPFLNIRKDNKSNCIIAFFNKKNCGYIDDDCNFNHFTVEELERLQTLPKGYLSCTSDSNARGFIANGWTVDVISHILSYLPRI